MKKCIIFLIVTVLVVNQCFSQGIDTAKRIANFDKSRKNTQILVNDSNVKFQAQLKSLIRENRNLKDSIRFLLLRVNYRDRKIKELKNSIKILSDSVRSNSTLKNTAKPIIRSKVNTVGMPPHSPKNQKAKGMVNADQKISVPINSYQKFLVACTVFLLLLIVALLLLWYSYSSRACQSNSRPKPIRNNSDVSECDMPFLLEEPPILKQPLNIKEIYPEQANDNVRSIAVNKIESDDHSSFSRVGINIDNSQSSNQWLIIGASSIGKGHKANKLPCQDNHYCSYLHDGWGIAVSCDGAGSADNSHLGSAFVSENTLTIFRKLIQQGEFIEQGRLPSENEWEYLSNTAFKTVYDLLGKYAEALSVDFGSLACTVIVVVYTPFGILSAHIGDGRAGYLNEEGQWKPLMIPHKGEEANQTIFITSSAWITKDDFKMSGVSVPECRIVRETAVAFTLMSDGCEMHSFECSREVEKDKWIDPNIPSDKFFNPLINHLRNLFSNNLSYKEIIRLWFKFMESGHRGLKEELDDKTLIIAIINKLDVN